MPTVLLFHPKRGSLPKWPGKGQGSYPYVGREFDAATRQNRATKEPASVMALDASGKWTDEAKRLGGDLCRRDGDLLPANRETAAFCGVPFVELEQDADGEWGPRAKTTTSVKKGGE